MHRNYSIVQEPSTQLEAADFCRKLNATLLYAQHDIQVLQCELNKPSFDSPAYPWELATEAAGSSQKSDVCPAEVQSIGQTNFSLEFMSRVYSTEAKRFKLKLAGSESCLTLSNFQDGSISFVPCVPDNPSQIWTIIDEGQHMERVRECNQQPAECAWMATTRKGGQIRGIYDWCLGSFENEAFVGTKATRGVTMSPRIGQRWDIATTPGQIQDTVSGRFLSWDGILLSLTESEQSPPWVFESAEEVQHETYEPKPVKLSGVPAVYSNTAGSRSFVEVFTLIAAKLSLPRAGCIESIH